MPVLALGGEKSYGLTMADDLEQVAVNVKGGVVPDSPATGSWKKIRATTSWSGFPGERAVSRAHPAAAATIRLPRTAPSASLVMRWDHTLTCALSGPVDAAKNDPQYARILSHIGGMRPGEHKPVPPFCIIP